MTAEIGILNINGVALASDSAGTLESGKIKFIKSDKLFSLSHHHSIGIMVYDYSEFMDIPWETIIKIYKDYVKNKSFATLIDCANDFINFLVQDKRFYHPRIENNMVESAFLYCLLSISEKCISKQEFYKILSDEVIKRIDTFTKEPFLYGLDNMFIQSFCLNHQTHLEEFSKEVAALNIDKKTLENLILMCAYVISKTNFLYENLHTSGIVIAGYGDTEIFPSIYEYTIFTIINEKLIYSLKDTTKIGSELINIKGKIMPFAQRDIVDTYMFGIDNDIRTLLFKNLNKIFDNLYTSINSISSYSLSLPDSNKEIINAAGKKLKNQLIEDFEVIQQQKYIVPFSSMLGFLGKEEMVTLAESLVKITSTRRRFSSDLETVGGPIDVALITKSDGFKWIKKKQYFSNSLNDSI